MVSFRSRKTGNCSNCSKNKLLQEKPRETFPGSFPIPGSPALCVGQGVGALARTHGNREASGMAPERQTVFGTLDAGGRTGMAQDGRALNGIVYASKSSKSGRASPLGVPGDQQAMCL